MMRPTTMRPTTALSVLALMLAAAPAPAQSPREVIFPGGNGCYLRHYTKAHLADHPDQLVKEIALGPWPEGSPDPRDLVLTVAVSLRGSPDIMTSAAYCVTEADHMFCALEGDAGSFFLEPAKDGAVRLTVSRNGMSLEGMDGYVTLSGTSGDDRVFLIPRVPADSCP